MKKFIWFGLQQALSCLFPLAIFCVLAISKLILIPFLPRYDFILLVCLITQFLMVYYKLESMNELKAICLFHIIGLAMEIYKVAMGSWAYPETSFFKIANVPLYSGFMYASVASYICQAWRRFDLKFLNWPGNYFTCLLSCAIYFNFFTHHYILDFRWAITLLIFLMFFKSSVKFTICGLVYKMPVILSFFLIGFFIWIAENISTFFSAWKYPNQVHTWELVNIGKISSWFLLVIVSVIIVVNLRQLEERQPINKRAYSKL